MTLEQTLQDLARAHGVATWYEDSEHHRVEVARQTVVDVLELLGIDVTAPGGANGSMRGLPPTIVLTEGETYPLPAEARITADDGGVRDVNAQIPADLPLGWYRVRCNDDESTLVVAPKTLPVVPSSWGWMLQLYALRSSRSWGMGDFADLAEFARGAGTGDAGFVLLNPLHAVAPAIPVQASPYSPSSRRFTNPLYLSVPDLIAYRSAPADVRQAVDDLRPDATGSPIIDYDSVWAAKLRALELLYSASTSVADAEIDADLLTFATFCALSETHGPDWRTWPPLLRDVNGPDVEDFRRGSDQVGFHVWLQRQCQEQLDAASRHAADAGLTIGLVHDLAVGVDPGGADAWMLADVLADGVRIGAPPDAFNQLGQDWGLAAWHPLRLAETGYAAYRDLLRRALRGAGGIRIDHVAGLWRLWWIPPTATDASQGTYVTYDADAMLGILALEAHRAGAVVIGEDLGTVPDAVTYGLRERNMLGSSVLWFARESAGDDVPPPFVAPDRWPANALASISTHDLPTAYGFLDGEHVRVRAELGLLAHDVSVEEDTAQADRAALLTMLGCTPEMGSEEIVRRMHKALADSPSRLVAVSLYDVLGEVRQPNLPGTTTEYPNWRLPLTVALEDVFSDRRVVDISNLIARRRAGAPAAHESADDNG